METTMTVAIPFASLPFPRLRLPLFEDDRFQATRFDSGADKARFANHFLRFMSKGFPEQSFTQAFYRRLSLCFSHIAHYDRHGFWGTFFTSTEGRIEFIDHTLRGGGYGDPAWTYCDVELAIRRRVGEAGVMQAYRAARAAEIEGAERELLRRLRTKYDPTTEEERVAPPELTKPDQSPVGRPPQPRSSRDPSIQLGLF